MKSMTIKSKFIYLTNLLEYCNTYIISNLDNVLSTCGPDQKVKMNSFLYSNYLGNKYTVIKIKLLRLVSHDVIQIVAIMKR